MSTTPINLFVVRVYGKILPEDAFVDIEFDKSDGIETLLFQLLSRGEAEWDIEDVILIDKFGRKILSIDDAEDVSFYDESISAFPVVEAWLLAKDVVEVNSVCSTVIPDAPPDIAGYASDLEGFIQPVYCLADLPFKLCGHCRKYFDESLLMPSGNAFSGQLQAFHCDIQKVLEIGFAPPHVSSELEVQEEVMKAWSTNTSPITLYLKRKLLTAALDQLRTSTTTTTTTTSNPNAHREAQQFCSRIDSTARNILVYEDEQQQEAARQHIDFDKVLEYAEDFLVKSNAHPISSNQQESFINNINNNSAIAHSNSDSNSTSTVVTTALELSRNAGVPIPKGVAALEERALLSGLMRWFKVDFFKWCNKPRCDNPNCNAPPGKMEGVGTVEPSTEEKQIGKTKSIFIFYVLIFKVDVISCTTQLS